MFADLGIGFFGGGKAKALFIIIVLKKVFALKRRRYVT